MVPQKNGTFALSFECPNGIVTIGILDALNQVSRLEGATLHITTAQKVMILGLDRDNAGLAMEILEKAGASVRKARDLSHPRTCVGKPYCPLALQDTFDFSQALYDACSRIPIVPKLKIGVSGCPACCSWANMMDLGFVGIRSGYTVYVGGHGGYRPKVAREIGRVRSAEEGVRVVRALADLFNRNIEKKGRVQRLLESLGEEEISKSLGL